MTYREGIPFMADAGTIRKPNVGTLTRADLADIVHREIGLSLCGAGSPCPG